MDKPIVNLTNWQLYVYEGRYNLSGYCDNHPQLGKNAYISRTSDMARYLLENDILTYETRNTVYRCPLKYMEVHPYGDVIIEYRLSLARKEGMDDLGRIVSASAKMSLEGEVAEWELQQVDETVDDINFAADDMYIHIKELQTEGQRELEQMKKEREERLIAIAKNYSQAVYIEFSNVAEGNTLAYHLDGRVGTVEPKLHVGTFQDSVLYTSYKSKETGGVDLDFRYFPKGLFADMIETYAWSENIERAVIKNDSQGQISFHGEIIDVGETKVFERKDVLQDGRQM